MTLVEGTVLPHRYDDGGFTGANTDRPALRQPLADVEAGGIDCVVVYKVDRLSRSLLDFARIMEVLDQRRVSFVSVTQQLNSSSPMGRLTAGAAHEQMLPIYFATVVKDAGTTTGWEG